MCRRRLQASSDPAPWPSATPLESGPAPFTGLDLLMLTRPFLFCFSNKKENSTITNRLPFLLPKAPPQDSLGPLSPWAEWTQSWRSGSSLPPWEGPPHAQAFLSAESSSKDAP